MDKKVNKGQGGGKHPRKLRGLALLLSLVIIFTCVFPFTAHAEGTLKTVKFYSSVTYTNSQGVEFRSVYDGFSTNIIIRDINQQSVDHIDCYFNIDNDISSGDLLTFQYNLKGARYQRGFEAHLDIIDLSDTSPNNLIVSKTYDIEWEVDNSEYQYIGTKAEATTNILVLKSITIPRNVNQGDLFVHLRISNVKYVNDYEYIAYAFPNVVINSDSKSVGLMNSIINWVKGIWEKLVNLPSEIGNFITNLWTNLSNFFDSLVGNLGDWFASIGDWFSDMVANLKQWFADIGDWFGSLGDRIGDFFVQIYVDITDFLSSLFLPSEDYFDNVQADLDQHMSDHLGAVYNVPKKLIWHLKDIVNGLESANGNHLVIHFPEIAFKLNGQRYSIFGGIDYDLLEPLNSLDEPATKSMINVALVLMHGFIDLGMAIAAFRMIYKQVINKVGIEGGSDL